MIVKVNTTNYYAKFMSRFIETIKLENGKFFRASFHRQRVESTFAAFFPGVQAFDPLEVLSEKDYPKTGLYKCRIEYGETPEIIEFVPYQSREIKSLKLVDAPVESTLFKSADRTRFNEAFAKRDECDDVLMVRDGFLTDTSYANVALWNGKEWLTPACPALFGTQRASLLAEGKITEADISVHDLPCFSRLRIFNAMVEFGEIDLPLSAIIF